MAARRPAETTILVVDDDAMMRTLVGRTLRTEGFQVWTASGAVEAGQVLGRIPGGLDLILTDVAMPGGMGPQLAAAISHAGGLGMLGHGIDLGKEDLLAKPFMPAELVARVRATLS